MDEITGLIDLIIGLIIKFIGLIIKLLIPPSLAIFLYMINKPILAGFVGIIYALFIVSKIDKLFSVNNI